MTEAHLPSQPPVSPPPSLRRLPSSTPLLLRPPAHIWINDYRLSTTLVGEFAPAAATDILTSMIFTPVVLALYNVVRDHIRFRRGKGCGG